MIVREIVSEPEEVLRSFDWFNDSKDTFKWLQRQVVEGKVPNSLLNKFKSHYKKNGSVWGDLEEL